MDPCLKYLKFAPPFLKICIWASYCKGHKIANPSRLNSYHPGEYRNISCSGSVKERICHYKTFLLKLSSLTDAFLVLLKIPFIVFQFLDLQPDGAMLDVRDCGGSEPAAIDFTADPLNSPYGALTYISRCSDVRIHLGTVMVPSGKGFSMRYREGRYIEIMTCLISYQTPYQPEERGINPRPRVYTSFRGMMWGLIWKEPCNNLSLKFRNLSIFLYSLF